MNVLFPTWIIKHFKEYKLPEVLRKDETDPCNVSLKKELRKYQSFAGEYMSFKYNHNGVLLYHGLGSGKTATAVNILNVLLSVESEMNIFLLIKASLKEDPWLKELRNWLKKDIETDDITKTKYFKNITFIHYDAHNADEKFMEAIKKSDNTKKYLFMCDEVHNFISNVYSNITNETSRILKIYDYIQKQRKYRPADVKIVLISGTPMINDPFELALLFNLLRPDTFPKNKQEFDQLFLSHGEPRILNRETRSVFQRRILGLVSYYLGADPSLFATKEVKYVNLPMSPYHMEIYNYYEKQEADIKKKNRDSKIFMAYTRQACNFVFPRIDELTDGTSRPRPSSFRISEKEADNIDKAKFDENNTSKTNMNEYISTLQTFLKKLKNHFSKINEDDKNNNHTLKDDILEFVKNKDKYDANFIIFYESVSKRSKLLQKMYECSPKMTAVVLNTFLSNGPVLVYSNYVKMEGIDVLKIYFEIVGFTQFENENKKDYFSYGEFHGDIDSDKKDLTRKIFNDKENVDGKIMKIIFFSPSGAEGKNLENVKQVHILEPHWTETRMEQVIGRAIRQCSHARLPMTERHVVVYRYKVYKQKPSKKELSVTTDEIVEMRARNKDVSIQSFLQAMQEAAVDCPLFKTHNMIENSYNCFQFSNNVLFNEKTTSLAYLKDVKDDIKYNISGNSVIQKVKVYKIKAVVRIDEDIYSDEITYWFDSNTGIVYDLDIHYPVGQIKIINDIPEKLNKDVYIITKVIGKN